MSSATPSKTLPLPDTGFVVPSGFHFGATAAAIRYKDRNDLALMISDKPATCAAVFTRNTFAAPPVEVSRELIHSSGKRACGVIVNAGCANAATGAVGTANAVKMSNAAQALVPGNPDVPVLVCSTGTIGVQLPMEKVLAAMPSLGKSLRPDTTGFNAFAQAILTTDTVQKIAATEYTDSAGRHVRIVACAKGSGMIQPAMATMLAFAATDAAVEPELLQEIHARVIDRTINCVTIDSDTSTNDAAILLASGASQSEVQRGTPSENEFESALEKVWTSIARQLASDGEGATKLIEVHVTGAVDFFQAQALGLAIANSPLVKTAVYGRDANWGRIAMAAGKSGVEFDPNRSTIRLGHLILYAAGAPLPLDEAAALEVLSQDVVELGFELELGTGAATIYTCDLTEGYIKINGSYRT